METLKPRVFVTQIPKKRDPTTRAFVDAFNITPAGEHGEILIMMPYIANFHAISDLIKQLYAHVDDYDYKRGDCVLLLGDTTIIAALSAILGKEKGRFILLKWDRNVGRYLKSHVQV